MDERNYGQEIDQLRQEVQHIAELLQGKLPQAASGEMVGHVQKMPGMHPDEHIMALLDGMENACGEAGETGRITYLGVFASGGRQSTWVRNSIKTDDLLPLVETGAAAKMLDCIGSSERLNMLLAILKKPRTVAELVEVCGLTSTGQAYHHMKPLLAVDLVKEDRKGTYIIQPHKVQGVVMLLAALGDMMDQPT